MENRVPIARCANTGISALIAPDGSITDKIALPDGTYREVEGTLIGRLAMSDRRSFYTAYGDVFAWLCVAGLFVTGATVAMRCRRMLPAGKDAENASAGRRERPERFFS